MKYSNDINELLFSMSKVKGVDRSLFENNTLQQLFSDDIVQNSSDYHDRNVYLTDNGIAYVEQVKEDSARYKEEKRRSWIQFWIPVCISLVSLIGAYRQEIAWLLQAIKKLLK